MVSDSRNREEKSAKINVKAKETNVIKLDRIISPKLSLVNNNSSEIRKTYQRPKKVKLDVKEEVCIKEEPLD